MNVLLAAFLHRLASGDVYETGEKSQIEINMAALRAVHCRYRGGGGAVGIFNPNRHKNVSGRGGKAASKSAGNCVSCCVGNSLCPDGYWCGKNMDGEAVKNTHIRAGGVWSSAGYEFSVEHCIF